MGFLRVVPPRGFEQRRVTEGSVVIAIKILPLGREDGGIQYGVY
jgi:hypothetical protein